MAEKTYIYIYTRKWIAGASNESCWIRKTANNITQMNKQQRYMQVPRLFATMPAAEREPAGQPL